MILPAAPTTAFVLLASLTSRVAADYNLIKNPPYCQDRMLSYEEEHDGSIYQVFTPVCPMFEAGTFDGVFPNAMEKKILLDANYARLFPEEFRVENGGFTYASSGNPDNPATCGVAQAHPYWWSASTTEMARFQHYTCNQCSERCGSGGHATCVDVTHYITAGRKNFFGWNRQFINSEAICYSMVGCMRQDIGHCGMFFNSGRTLWGPGFGNLPGQTGFVANGLQTKSSAPERHPLPVGAHFRNGTKLVFRAVYFAPSFGATAGHVYYKGVKQPMQLEYGDSNVGIYRFETDYVQGDCSAYFFSFDTEDTDGSGCAYTVRLPEDDSLFFGTSEQPDGTNSFCAENHYYLQDQTTVRLHDTPTYQNPTVLPCIGCGTALTLSQMEANDCPQHPDLQFVDNPKTVERVSIDRPVPAPILLGPAPTPEVEDDPTAAPSFMPSLSPSDYPSDEPSPEPAAGANLAFYAKLAGTSTNANIFEFIYDSDENLEAYSLAETVDESVRTGARYREFASHGTDICFVGNGGANVYCNNEVVTGVGPAVSLDVFEGYVYATITTGFLHIAPVSGEGPAVELTLNIPRPASLSIGRTRSCILSHSNKKMYCTSDDLIAAANLGSVVTWTTAPGKLFKDVAVRGDHIFALSSGSYRGIEYSKDVLNWEMVAVKGPKWQSLDYDPVSKYLCSTAKKHKLYCASNVDPDAGLDFIDSVVMEQVDIDRKPIAEVSLLRLDDYWI